LVEFIGHTLPYPQPRIEHTSKYASEEPVAVAEMGIEKEYMEERNEAYIGYQYKSYTQRYQDWMRISMVLMRGIETGVRRKLYMNWLLEYTRNIYSQVSWRPWPKKWI